MTTSAQTSPRQFGLTTPQSEGSTAARSAPGSRPRPDLPQWFSAATVTLQSLIITSAAVSAVLALITGLTSVPMALVDAALTLSSPLAWVTSLGVGAWCFSIAQSNRADPTTPQLNPVWFFVAWFVPVVHVFVPHRMFGDLWASAKWQQSDRRGQNTPLAPRPWILTTWAVAWASEFAWIVISLFRGFDSLAFLVHLGLSAASSLLMFGVVRAIARELGT